MMFIVTGGIYTSTAFDRLEPGKAVGYGPFDTYREAKSEWSGRARAGIDICCHRLTIKALDPHWRLDVDDAWRTPDLRRLFEAECGFGPLATDMATFENQCLSGEVAIYNEQFVFWAMRHLGLEKDVPLSERGDH